MKHLSVFCQKVENLCDRKVVCYFQEGIKLEGNLKSILHPLGKASGLPNAHYNDPVKYQMEKEVLFFNTWA